MARARPRPDELLRRPQFFPVGILDAKSLTNRSLNEQNLAWQAANAERARRREFALRELGLEHSHGVLFVLLNYGLTVEPDDLVDRAQIRHYWINKRPVTKADAEAALADCFRRGILQIVDDAAVARMKDEVRAANLLGPVYNYPELGGVDFTSTGAALMRHYGELVRTGPDVGWCCECVHEKTTHYYRSESEARADLEERRMWGPSLTASEVTPIGPWRAHWWRRYPSGSRVDIEERWKWTGRGGDDGTSSRAYCIARPVELARAVPILARKGIDLFEWLAIMSEVEGWHFPALAQFIGVKPNEDDYQAGIEAALRRGWLRPHDERTVAEIRQTIEQDDALMPTPYSPEIDSSRFAFTVEGAHSYRALSEEAIGPTWEDGLRVEVCYYRELHHYTTERRSSPAQVERYPTPNAEQPRSVREVPIGPWCIYWWERFPSGYRYESTYGTP